MSSCDQTILFAIKDVIQTAWIRHNRRKRLVGSKVCVHIGALGYHKTQLKMEYFRQRAEA